MSISRGKLLLICLIVVIVLVVIIVNVAKKDEDVKNNSDTSELITTTEDGTKTNTSSKLNETKTYNGLEITNINITEKGGVAQITAVVTNNTGISVEEGPLTINVKDKEGNVLQKVGAYAGSMKDGESRMINASINMDISNIYDLEVTE